MKPKLSSILHHLRRVVVRRCDGGLDDAQLLARFATDRDEAAFEVLVWRHGPMVLGVGRRLLHNPHDAEDVLQATFLALVRQARSIGRRESLGAWLHKVAYRIALRVRSQRKKQAAVPLEDAIAPETAAKDSEVLALLDEELQRMPEKYRTPLVLSYLQGLTNREIAAELSCPIGTVFTRLARGRDMLRTRLIRRGVTLSAGALTAALAEAAPAATLSADLARSTVQAALAFAAGSGAAAVPPHVAALTEGVLKMMWLGKLKLVVAVLMLAAVAGSGAGLLAFRATAREQEERKKEAAADEKPAEETKKPSREALRYDGKGFEDWRTLLLTELKPERRIGAFAAMSAFGTNGYAREAAAAVLEVLRGYEPLQPGQVSEDSPVIEAAQFALVKIGADAAPVLVEELVKGNRRSQLHALQLMPQLRADAKKLMATVAKAVESEDPAIRSQALNTLLAMNSETVPVPIEVIVKAAADKNPDVQYAAVDVIANLGSKAKEALPLLLSAADQEKHVGIRTRALEALKNFELDPKRLRPIVQKALKDDSSVVRAAALGPLGNLGAQAKDFVPRLIELLKQTDSVEEKIAIVHALGQIGPAAKEAVPALKALQATPGPSQSGLLPGAIIEALKKIDKLT